MRAPKESAMRSPLTILLCALLGCGAVDPNGPDGGDDGTGGGDDGGGMPPDASGPVCTKATEACDSADQCCDGLTCDNNSLGKVCCGGFGAACNTPNGTDCCGPIDCIDGVCGGKWDPATPKLIMYPVRGKHDNGYDSPSTGNPARWTCDDANSNSDFVAGDHLGNDIWAARGTPVAATVDGVLTLTGFSSYSGNKVTIKTDGNWYHFYCHLDSIAPGMVDGRRVKAGEIIGTVGNTGTASNGVVHLHYSTYPNGNYDAGINPYPNLHAVEYHVCP
jgi:hypothetical protein